MPNSLLWIGLVAVWLFVLVPMLVTKRPRIRRTSDVALATRVLHRGTDKPLTPRGPAAGHASDPTWRREEDPARAFSTRYRAVVDEPDPADGDVIAGEMGDDTAGAPAHAQLDGTDFAEDRMQTTDEYEDDYIDEPDERSGGGFVADRRGRGRFDPAADAAASAVRYEFRQRAVLGLLIAVIATAGVAFVMGGPVWAVPAILAVVLGGYLMNLRRQVRIEEQIRKRRLARLARSRLGVESRSDPELRLVPSRLRRPGAVVLEADDDDPVFDDLEYYDASRYEAQPYDEHDYRRAVGE